MMIKAKVNISSDNYAINLILSKVDEDKKLKDDEIEVNSVNLSNLIESTNGVKKIELVGLDEDIPQIFDISYFISSNYKVQIIWFTNKMPDTEKNKRYLSYIDVIKRSNKKAKNDRSPEVAN